MSKKVMNVAMIGAGFMGKAHANAWSKVNPFFDLPIQAHKKVLVEKQPPAEAFAERWGFEEVSYDWEQTIAREDIDIVDIVTPVSMHRDMAIAALRAGKHVICEKPLTISYHDALEMERVARESGKLHYLNHNYRRVPAVAYAKRLIEEGRLGTIYHWRGAYLQDWLIDPESPVSWKLQKAHAGGGPLYDLSSHAIDLARYLIGEPTAVTAVNRTFISQRPAAWDPTQTVPVDVDDASFAIVEFENGALGTVETTRFATGRKNYNDFEIYGSKGAIHFNFERMNELEFLDASVPAREQGFRRILVTEGDHPYERNWWPSGHVIGYEHTFVNAFSDFLTAIHNNDTIAPNFSDGAHIARTLEAILRSAEEHRRVRIDEIH